MTDAPTYHAIEWFDDVPRSIRKQAVFGLLLMTIALGGFGLWAFRAPLAAAVIAQGSFVATGSNKIVQHLEGGIIKEILVAEGDLVQAGEPVVLLDETAALAKERELFLRRARLEAVNARLLAEYQVAERITFPAILTDRESDPAIAEILESQRLNFAVSRRKLERDVSLFETNILALQIRANGYETQRGAIERQISILGEDMLSKEELLELGLVRAPEVNALRRATAEAEGQIGRVDAEVSETYQMIEKHEKEIAQTRDAYAQAALDEMQTIQAELDSVREQSRNAENVLLRSAIVAPVTGTVVRLHYHTSGGVIESGKAIVEILPADAPLILEAQVPRSQIDSVRTGETAVVRLIALNQRTTPVLRGEVFYLSADSIKDTSTGVEREFYLVRVNLPPSEIDRVRDFAPTPGMPAEIMIETAQRTFFDYLTKPIRDSMSRAFRER